MHNLAMKTEIILNNKQKNPYVSDGLIAMWDGEWNVANGIHDSNSLIWKDLVGNLDFSLTNNYSWDNNRLNIYSQQTFFLNNLILIPNILTIEAVGYRDAVGAWTDWKLIEIINSGYYYKQIKHIGGGSNRYYETWGANATLNGFVGWPSTVKPEVFCATYQDITNYNLYINNISKSHNSVRMEWGLAHSDKITLGTNNNSYAHHIYSIRLYNKVLSDLERSMNYSIDISRFNIT